MENKLFFALLTAVPLLWSALFMRTSHSWSRLTLASLTQGLRTLLLWLLAICLMLFVLDLFRAPKVPPGFAQQIVHTIDGKDFNIAEMSAKKPLLIYFWASGCSVCRYTTANVFALNESGQKVLAVASRSGDDIHIVRYLHGRHLTLPVVNDPSGAMANSWQITTLPTLLIVSKGEVIQSTTGWTSAPGIRLRLWWVSKWY